jgi:hypothetical protein
MPHVGFAQENQGGAHPLSAIDWLSDSLNESRAAPRAPSGRPPSKTSKTPSAPAADISKNALPEAVTVASLDAPRIDAAGLLPISQTGFPNNLWGASAPQTLGRRITAIAEKSDLLPASRRLLNTLILAELAPPTDIKSDGVLFLARIDALLAQGLLEEADALMARAGTTRREVFRRSFDTKLLLGTENEACSQLKSAEGLSPTQQARIFCLARNGDWNAAAITLEATDALNLISPRDSALLARFLDPELFEGRLNDIPASPQAMTPLTFRLLEAIGTPIPSHTLPLAFVQSDLRSNTGWKARATSAERLARVNAISANRWLGIWSEHLPAASGGIWDRIEALQKFETALKTGDPGAISKGLEPVWDQMATAGLQSVFAELFAERLADVPLSGEATAIARDIGLLSPAYETLAAQWGEPTLGGSETPLQNNADTRRHMFMKNIALGDPLTQRPLTPKDQAIFDGFRHDGVPVRLSTLVSGNRLGEAILRAIELLEGGAAGDLDELTDALQFFRAAGLEVTARRAALEILLLERRG